MNLSSLIVDVRPEFLKAVRASLLTWPGVDIHATTPEGKLIVTVETGTDAESTEAYARLGALEGVMSVAMVYHHFESDPEQEASDGRDAS